MNKKIFSLLLLFSFFFLSLGAFAKDKIEVENNTAGIYVFKINTKKYSDKIKPFMTRTVQTPQKVYDDNCFDLVVNAGFFDVKTGASVSYITLDGKMISDVEDNTQLIQNLKKDGRLEGVLNRSEFRVLENKRHKLKFDIAYHNDPIKKGYKIKHALQGGPFIYPTVDLVKEGFVIYDNDIVKFQSVDILKRRERTAIGLKDNELYIVIFTKDHKVDAFEMKTFMEKELKVKKAMAFDGGLSTGISYKNISIGSVGNHQRKVKSFLVIER